MPRYKPPPSPGNLDPSLTCLVDSRVVAELQNVEVAPLHAAPDAVQAGDVGALVLHGEQGAHHLLIAVMLEV